MTQNEILQDLRQRFGSDIIDILEKSAKRVYITIKSQALVPIATHTFKTLGARFNTASGIDLRYHMEILYHFTFDELDFLISYRVILPKDNLAIDSLARLFEGANWIEREMNEMFGINFKGHPELKRLLLPDEWPDGVYPLRREYQEWDKDAIRDRGV